MPVALTSVLQSLAVPHCFQAPWNSKSLALGMLQLTNSSYLDLPEPSCEVMPGHVTVISELPNGEQALQKLESIRCFFVFVCWNHYSIKELIEQKLTCDM